MHTKVGVCVCLSVFGGLQIEMMRPQGPFRLHISLMIAYISTLRPHPALLFIYSAVT